MCNLSLAQRWPFDVLSEPSKILFVHIVKNMSYRGINPLVNGGIESAASLHPYYQAQLQGNSSKLSPQQNGFFNEQPPMPLSPVLNVPSIVSQDQARFFAENYGTTRNPTRFDIQNDQLPIGGQPMQMHRNLLGDARERTTNMEFTVPLTQTTMDLGQIYRNPGVFDYQQAVRGQYQAPYTMPEESIRRMMRPPDEVDPELVTNPLPDQTFMARQPTFDHAPEDAATQRWRLQTNASMRFW